MPAAACEVSPASMGGRGDGKKGGGKGKGKGEGKGEGKGKGKGKGRGWMHGDGSPPREEEEEEEEEEEGHLGPLQLPGDGSGHLTPETHKGGDRSVGSCEVPGQLGHANAHAGRATGQLVRSTEDGDGPTRRFPGSPADRPAGRAVGGRPS